MDNENIAIEKIHPKLRSVVQEFLLKCKYPFTYTAGGRWLMGKEGDQYVQYASGVAFYDPHAELLAPVGTLKWQHGDFGRPPKFRVVTRKNVHARYKDAERNRSLETSNEQRALKDMLEHFVPYRLDEIAGAHLRAADSNIRNWRYEAEQKASDTCYISRSVMLTELLNMMAQGVEFITPEFQRLATEGIEAEKEHTRRAAAVMEKHFVQITKTGIINVLSPEGIKNYTAFDQLPTFIQETVGMLKMLGVNNGQYAGVNGMGEQTSDNTFWVIRERDPAGA